ncbi:acid phosphatase [Klebsiella michiganensis]|uniref:Acid phosphatase n=1 Tax=Klebsiella michiganensis TaxID=1134687 RepID=A0A7H4MVI3_9ENTR|nr:acid phosphatase [Klebsiella michiganensis]
MNWQVVTFFGDSTVLLPSAAVLFIVLFLRKDSKQLAWHWALLFGITGAIVCASKLAFMGWGIGIRELDFTGFSGHTALSSAFWPILLWLLCARATPALRFTAVIVGYALAGLVGYSRLMVHAHSTSEVIAGLLLGAAGQRNFSAATVTRSRHSYSAVILWQSGEHGDYPGASAEYGGEGANPIFAERDCGEDWPTGKTFYPSRSA